MWPVRAHWHHLANRIELVLPLAHPSPQTKQQIDRFSHFCTAHGKVSSGMSGHVLSPNNSPLHRWFGPNLIHPSLGPPESITQIASGSFQPFLHRSWQSVATLHYGPPLFPFLSNTWFLAPSEPTTQTPSWSVQPFLHRWLQSVPILYNGTPISPRNFPFLWGIWTPSNTWFPGPTSVLNPNGISISSVVFAGLTSVTDRLTDTLCYSVSNSGPLLHV